MRGLLMLVGVVALVVVVLMATGLLNIGVRGDASLPTVNVDTRGGSLPDIDAKTGSIDIGSANRSIEVPTIEMKDSRVEVPTIDVRPAAEASPSPAAR